MWIYRILVSILEIPYLGKLSGVSSYKQMFQNGGGKLLFWEFFNMVYRIGSWLY